MSVINTNVKSLVAQNAMSVNNRSMDKAMQQLSTGKRINSARDDAAGMSIATRMTHQIRSLNQAVRNAGDAVTLIQTAEGATNEITDMMQRMRELAIQAVNDTNDNADLARSLGETVHELSRQALELKLSIQLLNTGMANRSTYVPDPDATEEPVPLLKVA